MTRPDGSFTLTDDETGLRQAVSIAYPYRYGAIERTTVIVTLDAPWMFGTVTDATRIMSMGGEAPEAVVVGLGFGAAGAEAAEGPGPGGLSMGEYLRERARWYTPTPWTPPDVTGVKRLDSAEAGRADDLRRCIEHLLLPRLTSTELADTTVGDVWFAGHSFGGLFGLRSLFADPGLFDRWLLASPSIWWDGRAILRWEEEYAAANDDLPARVFFSYGDQEDVADLDNSFRMGANVRELHATLESRDYPGLDMTLARLEGLTHSSVIGAAVAHGLRSLNEPRD